MIQHFKYKIKPTDTQKDQLEKAFGCARFVYNWGIDVKKDSYARTKKTATYVTIAKMLTQLKKQSEYSFLSDVLVANLQQSLRNLESAFTAFIYKRSKFPKYKSKRGRQSVKYTVNIHFDFNKWKVKIPKCGWVKLCKNKSFDLSKCRLGTLTVSRDTCGEYWCSIVTHTDEQFPARIKPDISKSVGIDLGIKDIAILSDGTKFENPKFLESSLKRLRRLSRKLSKTKKGSKNQERIRLLLAKQYKKIANRRKDYLHKLTTSLIKSDYTSFCLEKLSVRDMMKNHNLASKIADVAWYTFKVFLDYKCERAGKTVLYVGRFDPSSKTCHSCGYINNSLKLSDRTWVCPKCGVTLDRDVNAAINIKEMAFSKENK